MPPRPHCSAVLLGLLVLAVATAARADEPPNARAAASYGYPIADPLLATVLGTPPALRAAVPDTIDVERRSLMLFPDREIPRVLWSSKKFEYSFVAQREPAPLIFLIAGTGSRFDSEKNAYLQKVLYQAGMSVVNISSPTHPDFIITASRSSVPGYMEADVSDLYSAMKRIYEDIGHEVDVSEFYIAGYSLGGTQSAYLAHLDQDERAFDFEKVLLINPSVSLKASVNRLDNMVRDSIPGGAAELQELVDDLFERVVGYIHTQGREKLDVELLFHAAGAAQLTRQELHAMIGVVFRISLARMLFSSDVMTGSGQLVDPETKLTRGTPLLPYLKAGGRWSFSDYLDDVLLPFWSERWPELDRDALILANSLGPIQDYLRRSDRIAVITSADDPIMDEAGRRVPAHDVRGARDYLSEGWSLRESHVRGECRADAGVLTGASRRSSGRADLRASARTAGSDLDRTTARRPRSRGQHPRLPGRARPTGEHEPAHLYLQRGLRPLRTPARCPRL